MLPLLGPATLFLVVWSTINALQLFDEIYDTTRGGPLQSTTVVVYYLYQQAFQFFDGRLRAPRSPTCCFVGHPAWSRCHRSCARSAAATGALTRS